MTNIHLHSVRRFAINIRILLFTFCLIAGACDLWTPILGQGLQQEWDSLCGKAGTSSGFTCAHNKIYYLKGQDIDWETARKQCSAAFRYESGPDLLRIDSNEELNDVIKFAQESGLKSKYLFTAGHSCPQPSFLTGSTTEQSVHQWVPFGQPSIPMAPIKGIDWSYPKQSDDCGVLVLDTTDSTFK